MWYKEWVSRRLKLLCVGLAYPVMAVISYFSWQGNLRFGIEDSLMQIWLPNAILATGVVAVIAGADLFAEEKVKNTISFLLSRPVPRRNIYTIKVLIPALVTVGAYTLTTLTMLGLAFTGTLHTFVYSNGSYIPSQQPAPVMSFERVLSLFTPTVVMILGIVALTTLISLLARTGLETIIYTVMALGCIVLVLIGADVVLFNRKITAVYNYLVSSEDIYWCSLVGGLVTALLYTVGLKWFKRREF